jgi:phosphoenolpyruvate-protein kinase (PTS system EI component)
MPACELATKFHQKCRSPIGALPRSARRVLALGIDSLSVVPTAIPDLKQAFAGARLDPMRRAIAGILALSDASSVAAALREAYSA